MELVVVIAVLAVGIFLVLLLLPELSNNRRSPLSMQNSTQVRAIHSGLVLYAQDNNAYYPGFNSQGALGQSVNGGSALTVENRLRMLLEANYMGPEYIISPYETKDAFDGKGMLTKHNYSFALLALNGSGERLKEWRETANSESVIVSDRAISTKYGLRSVHQRESGEEGFWRGSVAWNDNHVTFELTEVLRTKYGETVNEFDNLFGAAGNDDAAMACQGTDDLID